MKPLALALVLCTAIVCGCHYGLPFILQSRALALAERQQAESERTVNIVLALPRDPETPEPRHGLRMSPSPGLLP